MPRSTFIPQCETHIFIVIYQIPADCVPLEYAALLRELFTAYRLLEEHGSLKARSQSVVGPRER